MFQTKKSKGVINQTSNEKNHSISILKSIFEVIFNLICVCLVIFALLLAIASIARTSSVKKNGIGIATLGNLTYAPVASNSMEPTINVGDLVVGHIYKGQNLSEDTIITFRTSEAGIPILNTHRIKEVVYTDESHTTVKYYRTKGDNASDIDPYFVLPDEIMSVYSDTYKGVGKPILWLQSDPKNFFLGVVLPIIILFVIYAAIFIRALVNAALGKKRLAAATVDGLSEEDKKKLAEEYLAKLEEEKKQQDNTNTQDDVVDYKEDSKTAEDSSSDK